MLEEIFQLIKRVTLFRLWRLIQFQVQLWLLMEMQEMLSQRKRTSDGLKLWILHTSREISHKTLLLLHKESNLSHWSSTMLQLEERKTCKPSSKNPTSSKLKKHSHPSLETKPTLLKDKLGGPTMTSSAFWDSKFKFQLSEEQLQLQSKLTKTTLVMDKLTPSLQ